MPRSSKEGQLRCPFRFAKIKKRLSHLKWAAKVRPIKSKMFWSRSLRVGPLRDQSRVEIDGLRPFPKSKNSFVVNVGGVVGEMGA